MTPRIQFYAYVEDRPSQAVLQKIVDFLNGSEVPKFGFREGFPKITGGYGDIKKQLPACIQLGEIGLYSFLLTDLDAAPCPITLIRDWLGMTKTKPIELPEKTLLRVAVHETEAWLMADRKKFARFFDLTESLLPSKPDDTNDPKKVFFNLLRKKDRQTFRRMLPGKDSHIGSDYNDKLCDFIERHWSPERAEQTSPSLQRTMNRLRAMVIG